VRLEAILSGVIRLVADGIQDHEVALGSGQFVEGASSGDVDALKVGVEIVPVEVEEAHE